MNFIQYIYRSSSLARLFIEAGERLLASLARLVNLIFRGKIVELAQS